MEHRNDNGNKRPSFLSRLLPVNMRAEILMLSAALILFGLMVYLYCYVRMRFWPAFGVCALSFALVCMLAALVKDIRGDRFGRFERFVGIPIIILTAGLIVALLIVCL